jgi:hypothetical protein
LIFGRQVGKGGGGREEDKHLCWKEGETVRMKREIRKEKNLSG